MPNSDTSAARSFHDATKLSYISLSTKPPLYKSYPGLATVELPGQLPTPEAAALPAVGGVMSAADGPLDLAALAQLLHYSAGLIRRSTLRTAGEVHYRAAASAGALYPIELYVVCGDLPGLDAGVYHYGPATNSLSRLRSGDFRGNLAAAAADHPGVADAPATIVCSVVFWRSAWKYRERGYRYCFWDNGTILANMTATANALGQRSEVAAGFVDAEVDALLGLESDSEASFCLVPVGSGNPAPPSICRSGLRRCRRAGRRAPHRVPRDSRPAHRLLPGGHAMKCAHGNREHLHPRNRRIQRDGRNPRRWAPPSPIAAPPAGSPGSRCPRDGWRRCWPPPRRRCAPITAAGLIDTYLIVNAADGIPPGAYYYSPAKGELELLQQGEFREEAGHLCFEQALGADASAVAFFMADLNAILSRLGNRGYRAAQLEAGITGGRMYLASHAMGLGATGMTFFDDAVTAFFSPHAAGKSLMFLVGLGVTHERNQVHPFRSRIGILKDSLAPRRGGAGASGARLAVCLIRAFHPHPSPPPQGEGTMGATRWPCGGCVAGPSAYATPSRPSRQRGRPHRSSGGPSQPWRRSPANPVPCCT